MTTLFTSTVHADLLAGLLLHLRIIRVENWASSAKEHCGTSVEVGMSLEAGQKCLPTDMGQAGYIF
jgi:hypothetical protein